MAVKNPLPKKKAIKRRPVKKVTTKRITESKRKSTTSSKYKTASKKSRPRAAKRLKTGQWNKVRTNENTRRKTRTPDYDVAHARNIIQEVKTPKFNVEAGTIVRFSYRGDDVHEPRPLVLVLNPKWKKHLHGLALRVLTESELTKLTKMVKLTLSQKVSKYTGLRLNKLHVDINDPYNFYHKKLKKFIKKMGDSPYRTYTLTGISSVSTIDYRFKDMDTKVQKKLAKGLKPVKQYKFPKK